ncbi:hypothetical protein [Sphingosinicella humi]|uniref:Oligosaccharide repeat unit polymerase n=1 Tax=Allosphingosinicella humi TaxID=2068657 RepID=A0A2U2J194_9SPHN|nr:hypothetical protein [Sphingosinicella humi]PWG02102.1 hypothetical protein DF286_03885 [Sphingosinicella humi]
MNKYVSKRTAMSDGSDYLSPNSEYHSSRFKFVFALLFFRVVLDLCYVFYMHLAFGTHFLTPMPLAFDPFRYLMSYVIAIIPSLFVPYDKRDFSGMFFLIVLLFLYIPMTCMFGLDVQKSYTAIIMCLIAIATCFVISKVELTNARLPIFANGEKYAIFISYIFVAYFVLYVFYSGALSNVNFDLEKMYDYRELSTEILDTGIFAYLNLWTQKIFNPFILAIGIYRRNRLMVITAILAQIFFFAVTQHRSHLFLPILVYLASQLYVRRVSISGLIAGSGILIGTLLSVTVVMELETIPSLVIRRAFFVPASITFDWIEFFSDLPKIYWSDGILSFFIDTRYNGQSIPWYIGYYVSNGMEVAFNVGLIGSGYAQAGYFGVILYAVILGLMVKMVNTMIHSGLPAFLPAALLFSPVRVAWADADVLTALLSHGIFVGIVVMWLYGSHNASRRVSKRLRADSTGGGAEQPAASVH